MKSLVPKCDKWHKKKIPTKIIIVSGRYWKVYFEFYAKCDICRAIPPCFLPFFPNGNKRQRLHLNFDCWHWKWCMCFLMASVNFLIAVLTVSACIFYSYLVILFNVFALVWSMRNKSSIIWILFLSSLFCYKELKRALINRDYITLSDS